MTGDPFNVGDVKIVGCASGQAILVEQGAMIDMYDCLPTAAIDWTDVPVDAGLIEP